MIDIQEKKNKIISFLKIAGPSLPVRIAKTIEMDPVFASAILSELLGSKQIKTSHMKVGASPLYFLPGQEQKLEDHTENLKSIEQEALQKLKENKNLNDENEEPSIRVALRNIKDFATPFKSQDKIMWKYTFAEKEEGKKISSQITTLQPKEPEVPKAWEEKKEEINKLKQESKKIEPIFKKQQPIKDKQENNNKTFLKKIEDFLEKQNTQIISIEEVDKKKVIAKTKSENQTALLFAFNKKRITEEELMKCYKKAKTSNLPYHIITLGEPTKKMNETIDAYKKLIKIDTL
jgi:hypothetical protein